LTRTLLLVTHRPPHQHGGPAARWRSLVRLLPEHGWDVDVLAAVERIAGDEYGASEADRRTVARRARVMRRVGAVSDPAFALLGVRPEAFPLSTAWVPRGARDVRRRLASGRHDAVLATGPPTAALLAARAARRAGDPPLVVELRDLWAHNPLFDRRGSLLGALERWVLGASAAVVTVTPEAAADVRRRHPALAAPVVDIPNGFEGELLARRGADAPREGRGPLEILHSGTLTADRPLAPLLRVLACDPFRDAFRLTLHGHVAPQITAEVAAAAGRVAVNVVAPSSWEDAVSRLAHCDVALITQAASAGDATAVAGKVYEYLALGRPVLSLTAGGATEGVLRRLDADRYCARLDDEASIERALHRLHSEPPAPAVAPERLAPYERAAIARRTAELLDAVASRTL
jgi:glycosyltransferase involved in cell wall biosynthesis